MSEGYVGKLHMKTLEEWLSTPEGQKYKVHYDRLKNDMNNLMSEMDRHVYAYLESKYGEL